MKWITTSETKDIMETFLREYLKELFRFYEHFINEPEIEEHIQKNKTLKEQYLYILRVKMPIK